MGFFSDMMSWNPFDSGDKKDSGIQVAADPYKEVREKLNEWLTGSQGIGQTGPQYPGERTAPMSGYEQQSLDFLKQYGQGGFSQPTQQAAGEISKTLTGQYDPSSSPYYQAMKAASARNLEETQRNIGSAAAGGGRYWGGARLGAQGEAATERNLGMDALLGQLAETERQRRIDILPQAMQMGQYMQEDPLRKATNMQALGALPRNISQAANDAAYQQWMQEQYQYPMDIGQLAAGIQQPPLYAQESKQPGTGWGMLGEISPIVGSYNTHEYGYDTNQTSISQMMQMLTKMGGSTGGGNINMGTYVPGQGFK